MVKSTIYYSFMNIFHEFFKIIVIVSLIFIFNFSLIDKAYAIETPNNNTYLNDQLKQILNFVAPDNRGINYFILPDSSDLNKIPADPQNILTPEKIRLGQLLFHETALSINPLYPKHWQQGSCATCHFAQSGFKSNLPLGLGVGGLGWNKSRHPDPEISYAEVDKQKLLTPSILNSAYQDVMLWNGRAGSVGLNAKEPLVQELQINKYKFHGLETQAIDGMSVHKMGTAAIAEIKEYQELFTKAFPDRPYVSSEIEDLKRAGMAIAAYERTLLANQSPFQKWLKGDKQAMSDQEIKGAITFFTSSCVQCHTGANLAKTEFHAVGFADHPEEQSGLNLGRGEMNKQPRDDFKFKVPQLYNLADSSPYGHGASFQSLREVIEYFNRGEPQSLAAKYSDNLSVWFRPLNLKAEEINNLTTFLQDGLRDPNLVRYIPERLPSGLCFPNNDPISEKQLNCQ